VGWGLERVIGISKSLLFAGIGVCGGVNPPRGIRAGETSQIPSEAPSVRAE
jgi:putative transposase